MFSRLEVPDVGERFGISRISGSDVCRNWKLCFLTPTGRFNEVFFFKVESRGVKLFHRKEKSMLPAEVKA